MSVAPTQNANDQPEDDYANDKFENVDHDYEN